MMMTMAVSMTVVMSVSVVVTVNMSMAVTMTVVVTMSVINVTIMVMTFLGDNKQKMLTLTLPEALIFNSSFDHKYDKSL